MQHPSPSESPLRFPPLLVLLCVFSASCSSAKTPEGACERLLSGIRDGDASQVFDGLLTTTQWSLHTVAKLNHEMRGLIETSYPASEKARELQRLPNVGTNGRALFAHLYPLRYEATFRTRMGKGPITTQLDPKGDRATCMRAQGGGPPFELRRLDTGRWGMAELDSDWELAKLRAFHDRKTVQENARLYEKTSQPPGSPPR